MAVKYLLFQIIFLFYRGTFPFQRGPTQEGDGCPRFSSIKWGHPTLHLVEDVKSISVKSMWKKEFLGESIRVKKCARKVSG